jgi:hypothetical protein
MTKIIELSTVLLIGLAAVCQVPKTTATPPEKVKQASPLAEYAGDWTSTLDGKVWLRLQLVLQGDKLTGTMDHAKNLNIDDSGELKSVSEEQSNQTVTDAVVNPDGLVLTLKEADTQESDRFLMRLVLPSKQVANLRVIGLDLPPGMAKPKAWRLAKSDSTGSSSR